jgi:membrane protease YdiL (CAAX protease family)
MEISPAEAFGALMENLLFGMQPGITEEGICRVILMGIMMHLAQGRKNRLVLAVGLSSGIFGLLHLINIFSGAPVVETLFQVMYATAIGLLFAAVYARTRNIIATMIIHTLIDAAADFYVNFYPNLSSASQQITQGMPVQDVVIQVGITVLCLVSGLYLLRPAKRHEIEANWGSLDAAEEVPSV